LQLNDNKIRDIPSEIGLLVNLKALLIHGNPIRTLPMSIKGIWDNLEEFSIDWFSYLMPYLGRIMKIEPNAEYSKLEVQ
jgi:Leucine-rich repeat (LRR) protein